MPGELPSFMSDRRGVDESIETRLARLNRNRWEIRGEVFRDFRGCVKAEATVIA